MTQDILHFLFCLIGYVRKYTKRRDIHEDIIVKFSHVAGKYNPFHRIVGRFQDSLGYVEAVGKIIRSPCGNISQRYPGSPLHHPRHHFVNRTVSPAADNQVISVGVKFTYLLIGIPVRLRRVYHYLVIRFHENIDNIR